MGGRGGEKGVGEGVVGKREGGGGEREREMGKGEMYTYTCMIYTYMKSRLNVYIHVPFHFQSVQLQSFLRQ